MIEDEVGHFLTLAQTDPSEIYFDNVYEEGWPMFESQLMMWDYKYIESIAHPGYYLGLEGSSSHKAGDKLTLTQSRNQKWVYEDGRIHPEGEFEINRFIKYS